MSELGFLFAGYAVIWVILGAYMIAIARRQTGLRKEIERLERDIKLSQ